MSFSKRRISSSTARRSAPSNASTASVFTMRSRPGRCDRVVTRLATEAAAIRTMTSTKPAVSLRLTRMEPRKFSTRNIANLLGVGASVVRVGQVTQGLQALEQQFGIQDSDDPAAGAAIVEQTDDGAVLAVAARRKLAAAGGNDRFDAVDLGHRGEPGPAQHQADLAARLGIAEIEDRGDVEHDHRLAAQVEQAAHRGPRVRHAGDRTEPDPPAAPADAEAEAPPAEPERAQATIGDRRGCLCRTADHDYLAYIRMQSSRISGVNGLPMCSLAPCFWLQNRSLSLVFDVTITIGIIAVSGSFLSSRQVL